MLPSNLCGIVAQHDDLDQIEHLSSFGMVAKSTSQLWILCVQPSVKVWKRDKTKHQRILSRPKICNHESIREGKIFSSLRISVNYLCKLQLAGNLKDFSGAPLVINEYLHSSVIVERFTDMTSLISVKVQLSTKEKKSIFFLRL